MTDFPEELLLHILQYCASDAATLCALDATCSLFRSSLTKTYWETLALHEFGSGRGAKQAYLAGRTLTTRPPIQVRRENPPLQGDQRYISCLAASPSLIVMAVAPHPGTTERLQNFPIQVWHAATLKEASCWPILHEPCHRVAIVANDLVVLQTLPNEVWACHGCVKVKVLLPVEMASIRDMVGSQHGLALVQESKLCLYTPSTHAALALYQTIDLEEIVSTGPCALSWSLDHNWLAFAGATNVRIFQWTGGATPSSATSAMAANSSSLVQVNTFPHSIRMHPGATIAVSNQYVVVTRRNAIDDDVVQIFDAQTGRLLRHIYPKHWLVGLPNPRLYVSIVTHFLILSASRGVGFSLVDMRDGSFVRHFWAEEDYKMHSMVRLPSENALSFMATFNGGDQMVWSFEGSQVLI